jgi:antitoxin (DNA-binding transcriptional repressor) of toxin-antitoxin stability system
VVRRAADGEATVITVGGRPQAQLAPIGELSPDLDRLIAVGAVIPPRRTTPWRAPTPVPIAPGARLDRAIAEIR